MINFYKLSGQDLYWKIIDETTTVFQVKNSEQAKNVSKTTSADRYNTLIINVPTFTVIDETEYNLALSEVLSVMNN
jgi:hypothetical protein